MSLASKNSVASDTYQSDLPGHNEHLRIVIARVRQQSANLYSKIAQVQGHFPLPGSDAPMDGKATLSSEMVPYMTEQRMLLNDLDEATKHLESVINQALTI